MGMAQKITIKKRKQSQQYIVASAMLETFPLKAGNLLFQSLCHIELISILLTAIILTNNRK